jgi:hypothetical protein
MKMIVTDNQNIHHRRRGLVVSTTETTITLKFSNGEEGTFFKDGVKKAKVTYK